MKRYDLTDLSSPAIYQADEQLATLCRRVVAPEIYRTLGISIGDCKRALLEGLYPEHVKPYWDKVCGDAQARNNQTAAHTAIVSDLTPPNGYTLEVEGNEVLLKGRYDADLAERIKRQGGYWCGQSGRNRKCLVLPLTKASSIQRIFKNWVAKRDAEEQERAERERLEAERRAHEAAERRAAAEKREAEEHRRKAQAISTRRKVIAGRYAVGDELDGKRITGFGKSWTETHSDEWCQSGQRWDEECDSCGKTTVVDNQTGFCQSCYGGEKITVCYAYFC
jgi:hypothetical protein